MKKYKVCLTRDYIVEINAQSKKEAKEYTEFFVTGGIDASTIEGRNDYKFELVRIKPIVNEAFEVEEIIHE